MTADGDPQVGGPSVDLKLVGQEAGVKGDGLPVISLATEAQAIGNPIDEATAAGMRADIWFRGIAVLVVCAIFIGLNWVVMSFVREAFLQDVARMTAQPPMAASDRLVTTNVLMSLIGATVVQTGAGFIAIMSYLFPKRAA